MVISYLKKRFHAVLSVNGKFLSMKTAPPDSDAFREYLKDIMPKIACFQIVYHPDARTIKDERQNTFGLTRHLFRLYGFKG